MRLTHPLRFAFVGAIAASSLAFAPAVLAHEHVHIGDYEAAVGWLNEPTFVGQPNGIEITITDHDGKPVVDLAEGAIKVVVSTAGVDSEALSLSPGFSIAEGFGTPGQYEVELVPTAPGEYTFHFTGSIHDQAVDVSLTSGEETFSEVRTSSDLEFPVKNPTLADVATRLDRIDGRIEQLQADALDPQQLADLQTEINAARNAADDANRNALLGWLAGAIGIGLAIWASRRRATPA
jgi:hypothetical protein